MQKPLTAFSLILIGSVLGAGLVYVGRALERERLAPAALPDAVAPTPVRPPAPVRSQPSAAPAASPAAAIASAHKLYDDPPLLVTRAREGYEEAKKAALAHVAARVDELLLLGYVAAGDRDPALAGHLASGREQVGGDPFARLLDPGLPAPRLGKIEDRGLLLLNAYLGAAVGEPDEVALERLGAFAAREESGYALCHQLLALGWYEATGRRLTDEIETRRAELLRKLEAEQRADSTVSDLFAERASTLLLYGAPERIETRRWVNALLEAQQSDGTWLLQPHKLAFDGEAVSLTADKSHTVSHALFVLRRFLDTSATKP